MIRNPISVIGNAHRNKAVHVLSCNFDIRTGRRIFDGIVYKIDDDLNDELGIHTGKKQFVPAFNGNVMLGTLVVDMLHCLVDDLVHQLHRHIKIHSAFFDSCNQKQIFHKADQPL